MGGATRDVTPIHETARELYSYLSKKKLNNLYLIIIPMQHDPQGLSLVKFESRWFHVQISMPGQRYCRLSLTFSSSIMLLSKVCWSSVRMRIMLTNIVMFTPVDNYNPRRGTFFSEK